MALIPFPRRARLLAHPHFWALLIILAGLAIRYAHANRATLWVDEAESAINALTIQEHGYPTSEYLGIPIYENTLTEPWPEHPEYEFRDSSYSPQGVAVYHGWLPFYSIAAAQYLAGIRPDTAEGTPSVQHGPDQIWWRTLVPRLPALVFSAIFLGVLYLLVFEIAGGAAALGALVTVSLDRVSIVFGAQARYYSATLCMVSLAAFCLWRAARNGSWRSFIALGVVEGLLFHTHQMSAVVFAAAATLSLPALIRHADWLRKSAAAIGIAACLTVPWAVASGFFDTASRIPKVFVLFEGWRDWLDFATERPIGSFLLGAAVVAFICSRLNLSSLPATFTQAVRDRAPVLLFLVAWLGLVYAAFHLLVPAPSFFESRFVLMFWVPSAVCIGLLIGLFCELVPVPLRTGLAVLMAMGLIVARKHKPSTFALSPAGNFGTEVRQLLHTLQDQEFAPGTRIYANPNDHLVWTYYSGLPVQSVAPVRRSFLDAHPDPIVYLDRLYRVKGYAWWVEELNRRAARHHVEVSPAERTAALREVSRRWMIRRISSTVASPPPGNALPAWLEGELEGWFTLYDYFEDLEVLRIRTRPYFREVDAANVNDIWMSFFYRFVDYPSRIGRNLNIVNRLQDAEVQLLADASVAIYLCPPLQEAKGVSPGPGPATFIR